MTIRWRSMQDMIETLETLEGSEEVKGVREERLYCGIHRDRFPITHYATTEMYQDWNRNTASRCSMVYKLSCGHLVVDDCEGGLNGRTFANEQEWSNTVVSKSVIERMEEDFSA